MSDEIKREMVETLLRLGGERCGWCCGPGGEWWLSTDGKTLVDTATDAHIRELLAAAEARVAEVERESGWRRAKMIEWRDAAKRVESDRDRLAAENAAQAREIERLQTAIRRGVLMGNPDNIRRELRAALTPAAAANAELQAEIDAALAPAADASGEVERG